MKDIRMMVEHHRLRADTSEKNNTPRVSTVIAIAILALIVIANAAEADAMKIRITINSKATTATLIDNETTRYSSM